MLYQDLESFIAAFEGDDGLIVKRYLRAKVELK